MGNNDVLERLKSISEKLYNDTRNERLRISFEYTDFANEKFFLQGLDNKYYTALFATLNELKNSTSDDIKLKKSQSLEPKSIRWESAEFITENSFPKEKNYKLWITVANNGKNLSDEELNRLFDEYVKDAFEIRVGKNSGRIHGFIYNNVYHIIWFDPAHNLFPGKYRDGKPKKIKLVEEFGTVKAFCAEEINKLKDHNQELMDQLNKLGKEFEEYLDEKTKP